MFKSNKTPTIEAGQHYKFLELVLFYINFNFVQIGLRYRSPPIFWRVHSFGLCVVFYRSLLDILSFFLLSLYCLSFFYLRLLITSLVSSSFSLSFCPFSFVIVLSVLLFTASDYLVGIFKLLFVLLPFSFCHCIVCTFSINDYWLYTPLVFSSLSPIRLGFAPGFKIKKVHSTRSRKW